MVAYLKKSTARALLALALASLLTATASAGPKIPPEMVRGAIRKAAQYAATRVVQALSRRAVRGIRVDYRDLEPILRDTAEKAALKASEAAERRGVSFLGVIKAGRLEAEAVVDALGDAVSKVLHNRAGVERQALLKAKRSGLSAGFRSVTSNASDPSQLRRDVRLAAESRVKNEFEEALRVQLGDTSVEDSSLERIAKWLRDQGGTRLEDLLFEEVREAAQLVVNCVKRNMSLQTEIVPGKSIGGLLLGGRVEDALKTACGAFGKPEPNDEKGVVYVWDLGLHGHVGAELSPSPWFYVKMDEGNRVALLYTSSSFFRTRYGIEVGDIREHVLESVRPSDSRDQGEGYVSEYDRRLGFGWIYKNIDGVNRVVRLFVFPPR
ncbi:MAG: hypothetical protein ACRDGM_12940 [bacterium]